MNTQQEQNFSEKKDEALGNIKKFAEESDGSISDEALQGMLTAMSNMEALSSDMDITADTAIMQTRFNQIMDVGFELAKGTGFDLVETINWADQKVQEQHSSSNDVIFSVCSHLASGAGKSKAAGAFGGFAWMVASQQWQIEKGISRDDWLLTLCALLDAVNEANKAEMLQALTQRNALVEAMEESANIPDSQLN